MPADVPKALATTDPARGGGEVAVARPAATVVVLRQGERHDDGEVEVLMLRRHARSGFAASAWVFPGGTVDAADRRLDPRHLSGLDSRTLAEATGFDESDARGLAVAAVRETFEEAGLLLARTPSGSWVDVGADDVVRMRHALNERGTRRAAASGGESGAARGVDFAAFLDGAGLVLDLSALTPLSRWITPTAEPRRYDTLFMLAAAPQDQVAGHDRVETTDARWLTPSKALQAAADGEMFLIHPTIRNLETLVGCRSVEDARQRALDGGHVPVVQPHMERDGESWTLSEPGDDDYPWQEYPDLPGPGQPGGPPAPEGA